MPLWRIFYPAGLYSAEDKAAMASAITYIYSTRSDAKLPAFYVNVLFIEYEPGSFFVGGKPVSDFVRFVGEHIARHMQPDEKARMRGFMGWFEEAVAPWTSGKGVRWETHIDQTPFDLWRVSGLPAPPPSSEAEKLWREKGAPVPYEGMVSTSAAKPAMGTIPVAGAGAFRETKGLINATKA